MDADIVCVVVAVEVVVGVVVVGEVVGDEVAVDVVVVIVTLVLDTVSEEVVELAVIDVVDTVAEVEDMVVVNEVKLVVVVSDDKVVLVSLWVESVVEVLEDVKVVADAVVEDSVNVDVVEIVVKVSVIVLDVSEIEVDDVDEVREFVAGRHRRDGDGRRDGNGCGDRWLGGASKRPALFHEGAQFGAKGFQGCRIARCFGCLVLWFQLTEPVLNQRQTVFSRSIGDHFCVKQLDRGRFSDFSEPIVVHLFAQHDDFTVQFMSKAVCIPVQEGSCFLVRQAVDVAVDLLQGLLGALGPHFGVRISVLCWSRRRSLGGFRWGEWGRRVRQRCGSGN